jgi:TPR repeat protein
MYYYGNGVPQDYAEAVTWYRKAAGQGNREAEYGPTSRSATPCGPACLSRVAS